MSAFIVSEHTINVLIGYYGAHCYAFRDQPAPVHEARLRKAAQLLMDANQASVNQRYPQDGNPPANQTTFKAHMVEEARRIKPDVIFGIANCLQYQSCECDDYEKSEAFALLNTIRLLAIDNLPGRDAHPWDLREWPGPELGGPPKGARRVA